MRSSRNSATLPVGRFSLRDLAPARPNSFPPAFGPFLFCRDLSSVPDPPDFTPDSAPDHKNSHLVALAEASHAQFLVTGDRGTTLPERSQIHSDHGRRQDRGPERLQAANKELRVMLSSSAEPGTGSVNYNP
jgi:hypothetical protein